MIQRYAIADGQWHSGVLDALRTDGCALVTGVLNERFLERTRKGLYAVRARIEAEIGAARLLAAGEIGTLRLAFKFDPHFFEYLSLEPVLRIVDATVGDTAILHLLNGFILPPERDQARINAFQTTYHRDFPRYLNGYVASVNTFFAVDDFTEENGATMLLRGSHQRADEPSRDELRNAEPALGPAGSMLVFDSTIWHAAGQNRSNGDRLAINLQFTRSYIKQQIDYVRALGDAVVLEQPPRVQQLLGWYTRVVTSLDEYYQPEERRLYRRYQG